MKHEESKTKIIVLTGYILLIILLLVGIIGITYQIRKLSNLGKNQNESDDLITVSYLLATLYKAESIGNIIYMPNSEADYAMFAKKDSLVDVVRNGINYLKHNSNDKDFIQKLDTVEILLEQKTNNELKIFQLFDSIMKLPMRQQKVNTVLSQVELDNLTSVIKNRDTYLRDSTRIAIKEKTFSEKFGDLFRRTAKDSIISSNSQTLDIIEEIMPVNLTLDTISQYVTDFMFQRSRKIVKMTATLTIHQLELQNTNDILFNKINMILRSLETRELRAKEQFTQQQNDLLLRSNMIAYIVALAALIISILFIFNTMRLINRHRKYRKKLEKSNIKIEKFLKLREWLILSVSHDIKAPISSILAYTDVCMESNNLTDTDKNCIINIKSSALQVLELINNLINFHKIEQKKLNAKFFEFSPYNLVNEIFVNFESIAHIKQLKFILKNNLYEDLLCKNDPLFINNIINNLISNALKFTKKGEVEFSAHWEQNTNELIFSVRDSGIGIAEEDLHKLFDEFERTQSSEIQHIEGSGLGLSISQRLTKLIGGKIYVNSVKGEGSTFTLCVPANDVKTEENLFKNIKDQDIKNKKLLFIDDDLLMLKVCEQMAKKLGYIPYATDKANNVVNILSNNKIDIVFCDINMPEMKGFSLIENIKKNTENPSLFIALSASANYSEDELKEKGFVGFLQKPLNINVLELTINKLLNEINLQNKCAESGDIDFNPLINYAGGDKEASIMIMRTFISENVKIVHEIEQAIAHSSIVHLKDLAHKLLPRMQMIKNKEIVKILYALERGEIEIAEKQNLQQLIENVNAQAQEFIKKKLN
ncbi:MAG: ATP-binding protein [Paludibacter sp.]|nr:ATP-binding protein [Paludibacter sp.]